MYNLSRRFYFPIRSNAYGLNWNDVRSASHHQSPSDNSSLEPQPENTHVKKSSQKVESLLPNDGPDLSDFIAGVVPRGSSYNDFRGTDVYKGLPLLI